MDPVTVSVASALLGAVATDSWEAAKSAVVNLWRRAAPEQAALVESDLGRTRQQMLTAQPEQAAYVADVVTTEWTARLQSLLLAHPEIGERLAEIAGGRWAEPAPAATVSLTARATDSSRIIQAGGDLTYHGQ